MKKDIHPQYYPKAKISCACGTVFTVGATRPEIKVEICSACHPFYTGKPESRKRNKKIPSNSNRRGFYFEIDFSQIHVIIFLF
ncbi:MAG: 50S ribosomal protein L31 [Candidatus Wolfebacteria bacterium]|nr:50S ribosomal protein L31 [Candidatus Wolfebacteria bacterium]